MPEATEYQGRSWADRDANGYKPNQLRTKLSQALAPVAMLVTSLSAAVS